MMISGKMFESYLRYLFCQPDNPVCFDNQLCVGKQDPICKSEQDKITLGGCKNIRCVLDPIESALQNPMTIFYSSNPSFPLFDFCYFQNREKQLVLVQATTSTSHDSKENSLKDVETKVNMLNEDVIILLCYATPTNQYQNFKTNPVSPKSQYNLKIDIIIINVQRPAEEFSTDEEKTK
jgi:hypothetical protein